MVILSGFSLPDKAARLLRVRRRIAAAAIQSSLASLGPAGATVGFIQRPVLGYLATVLGMAVGQNLSRGRSLRASIAHALRDFRPGRDFGQLVGGTVLGVLGQVLIPIAPPLGGIVGGLLGGLIGAAIGRSVGRLGPFSSASAGLRRKLGQWADRLENRVPPLPAKVVSLRSRSRRGAGVRLLGIASGAP